MANRKPKRIVLKSDDEKKFGPEVFDLVRNKLAVMVGGNVGLAVGLAAAHFAPRMQSTVKLAEMEDTIPQIIAKFEADKQQQSSFSNTGRLPLNDEAQKEWDSGRWRGKITVHGLRKKYEAEIKDGVDLTVGMLDAYAAELAAEKARIAALVDEKPDPDSKPVGCGSPIHRGGNEPFQPTVRFRLTRNDAGELVKMKHSQGEDFIQVGNFLVVPSDEENTADRAVPYCADCREAAWELGRETQTKVTFYTAAGAQRKLGKMKESAEGNAALAAQIRSAGARTFSGMYGTRKGQRPDWRQSRGR